MQDENVFARPSAAQLVWTSFQEFLLCDASAWALVGLFALAPFVAGFFNTTATTTTTFPSEKERASAREALGRGRGNEFAGEVPWREAVCDSVLLVTCGENNIALTHGQRGVGVEENALFEWNRLRGLRDTGRAGQMTRKTAMLRKQSDDRLQKAYEQCIDWLSATRAGGTANPVICVVSKGAEAGKKITSWLRRAAKHNAGLGDMQIDVRSVIVAE